MALLRNLGLFVALCLSALNAQAALYAFSYTFDASFRGTPGHVLEGIVEGTLQPDGDTGSPPVAKIMALAVKVVSQRPPSFLRMERRSP